ncbi:MAG: bifunctional diaminohydroxyphosphoribosylaminopyrimidine deaminase/5-amino-6-(5-phosphoribosylamino)uracil reductase RibD [Thermodesulfovibrionales bacterium]|nr:bifunctional diaminohydroxyphosphoribosylaminopyrimidine deaminase/5-amino-6-(5-phosphoribosylamino)uracil reductase RibD [Thermodesulfovibrionales bacterium]
MIKPSNDEIFYMKRALSLAEKARGRTSPNPMGGAVLVKEGKIISEDYHKKAGQPHAEALALMKAGLQARGADLFVTLEPCCHLNKRTPPCTRAIIEAGIKRVFVAMIDPNPAVAGCGIKELQSNGIEVYHGILEQQARELNEAYCKYIVSAVPFVILKTAMTLDGKITDAESNSKWITGKEARKQVHRLRNSVDAIISAKGTVLADNPLFTSRIKGGKNPIRVIIDPALEIPEDYNVFNREAQTIVIYAKSEVGINQHKIETLFKKGCKFIEFETSPISMRDLVFELGRLGITSVLIEGGSSLNSRSFSEKVVDRAVFFIAPKIVCGEKSMPVTSGRDYFPLNKAIELYDIKIKRFDKDIMINGLVHYL